MKKGDWLVFVGKGSKFSPYKNGHKYQLDEDYNGGTKLFLNISIKVWKEHPYYIKNKIGKKQYFFITLEEYREKQLNKILCN